MSAPPDSLGWVRQWIAKAEADLTNAEHTLTLEEGCPLDTVWSTAERIVQVVVALAVAVALAGPTAVAAAARAAATAAPFELEDVLSAPYPTALVAARAADRIAWVMDERGVRNLWTAAAPGFEPRQLTRYDADDGQALGSVELCDDGSVVVWVRGGPPNSAGEIPNPASDPAGVERAIWAVRADGAGEPWKVAAGAGPALAPGGDRLVFAKGSDVFIVPVRPPAPGDQGTAGGRPAAAAGGSEAPAAPPEAAAQPAPSPSQKGEATAPAPERLLTARGRLGSLTWSPDGGRLAFVSDRDDHAFIGVYDLAAKTLTWMAPDVDVDAAPTFSPDGSRLAFLRFPGHRMGELLDITAGVPFAIWVGDPATGAAREVWRSPGADGGFAQYYPDQPLAWGAGDRLLFTSEHEGWMHLYSLPAAGGEAVDLTPGEGEVEGSALAPDGRFVFVSSNRGDAHRRHLWRVAVAGGEAQPLTPGEGIETDPAPLPGGGVAFRGATFRHPQAVEVTAMGGGVRRVAPEELPGGFPADRLVAPEVVSFTAADGLALHGELFLPPGARPGGGRPALIFFHGGPVRQMLQGWHYSHYYANAYAFNQYMAARGYVVLALNYRTGIGYGRAFRQAPEQGPRGAAEYRDVLAAGLYLRRRPEVDPARIGLWGGSYGGYLTAMGLARNSDLFAAGVDLHGVHDWAWRGAHFPLPGGAWGLDEGLADLARRSSPDADLSLWSSPVLLVQGDDDRNVLFIQTIDLAQRLRERRVHVETLVFPDEVHGFLRYTSWLRTYRAAADFFDRFLGRESP
jgi:dipeptidyl aminopeptidase/acylaminoacyl peptidase